MHHHGEQADREETLSLAQADIRTLEERLTYYQRQVDLLSLIILSTQCVVAMLWSVVQLRRGHLRMVVDVVGGC